MRARGPKDAARGAILPDLGPKKRSKKEAFSVRFASTANSGGGGGGEGASPAHAEPQERVIYRQALNIVRYSQY